MNGDFTLYTPTKVVFGHKAEEKVGELICAFGGSRVLIHYGGGSVVRSGLLDRVKASLEEAGLFYVELGGVVPNPQLAKVYEGIELAKANRVDFILAVGGGSVIDSSKAIAYAMGEPEYDVKELYEHTRTAKASYPLGAVLTIAAAGSEMSDSSVISYEDKKRGYNSDLCRPRFAIMDPELTMTLPKYQIGAGAADIFMHTSERYFAAILGNHLTDEIAEGLFRDIIAYGPKGVQDPSDYEAMSEIMWCGSVSHVGLTGIGAQGDTAREGDWACHQLGMAISALYDSTHGATLTAVWAAWCRYVMSQNVARFAQFARKVYGIEEPDDGKAAEEGIERTNAFFRSLGMPLSLTELLGHEPTDEEIEAIAMECTYDRKRKIGSFKVLDYDDIVAIYKACR